MSYAARWPALPSDSWRETYRTLHMWTQVVGKICLALTPLTSHFWNMTLQVTSHGLMTPLMYYQDRALTITFDFIAHQLVIQSTDGGIEVLPLEPQSVADFYRRVMAALRRMNIEVRIWTMPVEVPNPIRFEDDVTHSSYDPVAANTFWRILVAIKSVFEKFRSE